MPRVSSPQADNVPAPLPANGTPDLDRICVSSEVGPLRQVIVHTPGDEMSLVAPDLRLELLFDDVLFPDVARREHLMMADVIRAVVGREDAVLEFSTLLLEAFAREEARLAFIEALVEKLPAMNFRAAATELERLTPDELHRFAFTGESPAPVLAFPVPNALFTRDLCAVVNDHVILSMAAKEARARESLMIRIVAEYHPRFAAHRDRLIKLPDSVSFEGGDLLVLNEKMVLIGQSERTSLGGVMAITSALFERTEVEHVLLVNLPKQRSCMHLDTVFTFIDRTECVVFPPLMQDRYRNNVLHFTQGSRPGTFQTEILPNLEVALESLRPHDFVFIPCGGDNPLVQKREQWTDGANFFAIAPGVVLGYERNQSTFDTLRRHGYRVVGAESFLSYHRESPYQGGEKIAIKLVGTELSRGRGGPRCMTLPILRDPLDEPV